MLDVRHLYACDGRTLGEWCTRRNHCTLAQSTTWCYTNFTHVLSKLHTDYTIQAAHLDTENTKHWQKTEGIYAFSSSADAVHQPISDALLDKNRQIDAGYLPRTVLQIYKRTRVSRQHPYAYPCRFV